MKSESTKMVLGILLKMIMNPSGSDILYNHGLRVAAVYVSEHKWMLDRGEHDEAINNLVAHLVETFLIIDPESNDEFAFNNGLDDAIDIIRSHRIRR